MPRMRFVKHEFFMDDALAQQSHTARLLFIGLWTLADRAGRLEDKPAKIKAQLFPYEQIEVEHLLNELACGFIIRYERDGKKFIQIKNFLKHQRPHHKEPDSAILPPPNTDKFCKPGLGTSLPGKVTSQPGGSLVLENGSLRMGSGITTANGSPAAVDFSEYRLPAGFGGHYGGAYVVNLPPDECAFLLKTMPRLGRQVKAALQWRIDQKRAEMTPAQRTAQ